MATADRGSCHICYEKLDKKHYRNIRPVSYIVKQITALELSPGVNYFACQWCFNRMNRLQKLDLDIRTRVDKLREERCGLLAGLKSKHGAVLPPRTPVKGGKRMSVSTPTPKKTVKRPLVGSPQPGVRNVAAAMPMERSLPVQPPRVQPVLPPSRRRIPLGQASDENVPRHDLTIKRDCEKRKVKDLQDFDVKVTVKYLSGTINTVVTDPVPK